MRKLTEANRSGRILVSGEEANSLSDLRRTPLIRSNFIHDRFRSDKCDIRKQARYVRDTEKAKVSSSGKLAFELIIRLDILISSTL